MLVFEERGKPEYPEKNLSVQRREPTNSTHIWRPSLGIDPGPHWWEGSALTTVPSLHGSNRKGKLSEQGENQYRPSPRVIRLQHCSRVTFGKAYGGPCVIDNKRVGRRLDFQPFWASGIIDILLPRGLPKGLEIEPKHFLHSGAFTITQRGKDIYAQPVHANSLHRLWFRSWFRRTNTRQFRDFAIEKCSSYRKRRFAISGFKLAIWPYLGVRFASGNQMRKQTAGRHICFHSFVHFCFTWKIVFKITFLWQIMRYSSKK